MSKGDTISTSLPSSEEERGKALEPESVGELDDEFFANARVRKGGRIIREATATLARRGRPPKAEGERKEKVTLRLSPDVLTYFRGGGDGWQTRIDETLKEVVRFREAEGADEQRLSQAMFGAVSKGEDRPRRSGMKKTVFASGEKRQLVQPTMTVFDMTADTERLTFNVSAVPRKRKRA